MDPKERNALDKCFQGFLRDLDPSVSFVHSLYADRVITEAQAEQINSNALRETKVTLLMKFLPQRGPNAYRMFKATLEKDYKWLADKLDKELSNLQSDRNSFPKRVSQIIKMQLDPLVHGYGEGTTFDENSPDDIAKTLGKTLRTLDVRCHQALNEPIRTPRRPLHVMIKGKMIQAEHLKVQPTPRGDNHTKEQDNLKTKNRELKKQVQELAKLKTENEKLADRVKKQRERLQECSKATRETKKLQEELERCKRENEQLKGKVDTLQEQFYT